MRKYLRFDFHFSFSSFFFVKKLHTRGKIQWGLQLMIFVLH